MERRSLLALTVLALAIPVTGCGGGVTAARAPSPTVAPPPADTTPASVLSDDAGLVHLLSRITYGPRPEDLARTRRLGSRAYLEEQLDPDGAGLPEPTAELRELRTLTMPIPALLLTNPRPKLETLERLADGRMS